MKLAHEFYKLPLIFDIEKLQSEIATFNESDWSPHHENFDGNYAIPLISVNGEQNNDFKGRMRPTPALKKTPYIQQIIASFGNVIGRSRLMRLDSQCEVPAHFDINYYWYHRVRIHIPIVTDPKVIFYCGKKQVHMAAGEAWIFDSWKTHRVVNDSKSTRIHLVIDTSGSGKFWSMVNTATVPGYKESTVDTKFLPYVKNSIPNIFTENLNAPPIMTPGELECLINELKQEIRSVTTNDLKKISHFEYIVDQFKQDWRQLWYLYGMSKIGWDFYLQRRELALDQASQLGQELKLSNGGQALKMLVSCIIVPSISLDLLQ